MHQESCCNSLNGQRILSKTFWHSVDWQILIYIVIHFSKNTLQGMNYANKGCSFPSRLDLFVSTNSIFNQFVSSERLSRTVLLVLLLNIMALIFYFFL